MCSHKQAGGCMPLGILATCHICNPSSLFTDPVGPFPDEIIMSVLDRIIYYSGATKIFHYFDLAALAGTLATPKVPAISMSNKSCSTSCGSLHDVSVNESTSKCSPSSQSRSTYGTARNMLCSSCAPKTSSLKSKASCNKSPCSTLRVRSPHVDFANPISDNRPPPFMERMKRSLSTCSIVCKQLKSRLAASCKNNQRWVWTRLVRSGNGCKAYEVYQNSANCQAPNNNSSRQPDIVFLVMPNGQVMPFETVSASASSIKKCGK